MAGSGTPSRGVWVRDGKFRASNYSQNKPKSVVYELREAAEIIVTEPGKIVQVDTRGSNIVDLQKMVEEKLNILEAQ